jgi:hypothetical protein
VGSLHTEVEVAEPDRPIDNASSPDRTGPLPPGVLVGAGVLILAPIVALMWVGTYSKDPEALGASRSSTGTSCCGVHRLRCTYLAYLLVHNARRGGGDR